jgi:thymidine phosphorylase
MLLLASVERDRTKARARLEQAIAAGRAVEKFRQLVAAQGGNSQVVDDPGLLPHAPVQRVFEAPMAGYVTRVAPRIIGKAIVTMGGGRRTIDDEIDHRVGFVVQAKPGDAVNRGTPLARVLAGDEATLQLGIEALAAAVDIAPEPPPTPLRLVSHRVTHDGVVELA